MRLKSRLRTWLIDLVREAVRVEMISESQIFPAMGGIAIYPGRPKATAPPSDPTFEQMQDMSLREQEKFYEKP